MQTVLGCPTPVSLEYVDVEQTYPAPKIHRINVTLAHADVGSTLHVLKNGQAVYPETAVSNFYLGNKFQYFIPTYPTRN